MYKILNAVHILMRAKEDDSVRWQGACVKKLAAAAASHMSVTDIITFSRPTDQSIMWQEDSLYGALAVATEMNDISVVQRLLSMEFLDLQYGGPHARTGSFVLRGRSTDNVFFENPVLIAASCGFVKSFGDLLAYCASGDGRLNWHNESGELLTRAFVAAACNDQKGVIQVMFELNPDLLLSGYQIGIERPLRSAGVEYPHGFYAEAIRSAIEHNHLSILQLLCQKRQEHLGRTRSIFGPCHCTLQGPFLRAQRCDGVPDPALFKSLLFNWAAQYGRIALIQHLWREGVDLAYATPWKPTDYSLAVSFRDMNSPVFPDYLRSAAGGEHNDVVQFLVELDSIKDTECYARAACAAIEQGHKAVVECLLDAGLDVNAVCHHPRTARKWHLAVLAAEQGQGEILRMLVKRGAQLSIMQQLFDEEAPNEIMSADAGRTKPHDPVENAVATAAAKSYHDVVRTLVEMGASLDLPADNPNNPVVAAMKSRRNGMVELLVELGAKRINADEVSIRKEWRGIALRHRGEAYASEEPSDKERHRKILTTDYLVDTGNPPKGRPCQGFGDWKYVIQPRCLRMRWGAGSLYTVKG